jgi:hypothetical protein
VRQEQAQGILIAALGMLATDSGRSNAKWTSYEDDMGESVPDG